MYLLAPPGGVPSGGVLVLPLVTAAAVPVLLLQCVQNPEQALLNNEDEYRRKE